jgi:hypothetical protein
MPSLAAAWILKATTGPNAAPGRVALRARVHADKIAHALPAPALPAQAAPARDRDRRGEGAAASFCKRPTAAAQSPRSCRPLAPTSAARLCRVFSSAAATFASVFRRNRSAAGASSCAARSNEHASAYLWRRSRKTTRERCKTAARAGHLTRATQTQTKRGHELPLQGMPTARRRPKSSRSRGVG